MLSILFNSESKKEVVISKITESYSHTPYYLFEICGVDVESFLEDVCSKNYYLHIDSEHFFLKELPRLFLFSTCHEDVKVFSKYIGDFNEGYMNFYILKDGNVELCNMESILLCIQRHSILTIEVLSDGDELRIVGGDEILKKLENMIANGDIIVRN